MSRLAPLLCVVLAAALQVHKLLVYFPHPADLLDPAKRLTHVDFPVMEYQMEAARRFFDAGGALWGYDPFYLNGFPLSFLWNSNVCLQILGVLTDLPSAEILKLFFAGCIVLEPFLVYTALRNFGIGREAGLWATLVVLLYLKIAHPVLLLASGMLTSYLVVPVFLLAWSLLYRVSTSEPPARVWLLLPWVLAAGLLVHKTFVIFAAPTCAVLAVELLRRRDARRIAYFCGSFAFAFALNAFWIVPALALRHHLDFSFNSFFRHPFTIPVTDWRLLLGERIRGVANGTYLLVTAGAFLALRGLRALRRDGNALLFRMVVATAGTLAFLVAFGFLLPGLEHLHAVRFHFALGTLLSVPGAALLDRALRAPAHRANAWRAGLLALAAGSLALPNYERVLGRAIAAGEPTLLQRVPLFRFEDDPAVREAGAVRAWLLAHVPPGEGIFLSTYPGNHYLSGLYVGSGLRFVSAPYNHIYLEHNYVNRYFQDVLRGSREPPHMWGGEPRAALSPDDFARWARFFGARWWVVDRAGSDYDLAAIDGMTRVETLGRTEIYRYDAPMSDFAAGAGDVEREYGRIVIRNARPEDGALVLKMHWFDGFRVKGALGIRPAFVEGLPVPFVRIEDPEPTVELRF